MAARRGGSGDGRGTVDTGNDNHGDERGAAAVAPATGDEQPGKASTAKAAAAKRSAPKRPAAKRTAGKAGSSGSPMPAAGKEGSRRSAKPAARKKITKPVAAMKEPSLGIDAGNKPQVRRKTSTGWTRKQEVKFLETLAETCNVLMAAEAADVWPQSAYQRRKLNAAFRNGWAEALRIGYARLELVLLERALQGSEKIVRHKDGSEERMREYSNQVALTLLKLHRDAGGGGGDEGEASSSAEEARDAKTRIARKLSKLKERFDGTDVLAIAYGGAAAAGEKLGGAGGSGGSE